MFLIYITFVILKNYVSKPSIVHCWKTEHLEQNYVNATETLFTQFYQTLLNIYFALFVMLFLKSEIQ